MTKAKIVFNKLAQLDATRKGAKIISDAIRKKLVKSLTKHKGKESAFVATKNNFLKDFKAIADNTSPKVQAEIKGYHKQFLRNIKHPIKFINGKL
jgi:hypothetical protein